VTGLRWVFDRELRGPGLARLEAGGLVGPLAVFAAVALYLAVSGDSNYDLLTNAGITAVLVIAYQLFVGNTGIVSFGHMAFMGLGAYAGGLLALPVAIKALTLPELPGFLANHEFGLPLAMIAGGIVAAIVALLSGFALMRLTGAAAGITTLGLLVIVNEVLRNARSFTRGTQTFFGVPASAAVPQVFITLCVVVAISLGFKFTRWGLRARAVRDDPLAAETSGINVLRARMAPWVLSAFLTGAAGALWAHRLTAFSPKSFFIAQSVPIVVMTVLGGINSVAGGLAGTIALTAWLELMRRVEGGNLGPLHFHSFVGIAQLTVGVGLVLLLWRRPEGILGSRELELSGTPPAKSRGTPPARPAGDADPA